MTKREELRIALELATIYDFVPEYEDYEHDLHGGYDDADIEHVCKIYVGEGYDRLNDTVHSEYFTNNKTKVELVNDLGVLLEDEDLNSEKMELAFSSTMPMLYDVLINELK